MYSRFLYIISKKGVKNMDFLTLEDLAKELGRSENTLRVHFDRTKENLAKKGIIIERYGTGKTAKYTLEYEKCQNNTK